MTLDVENLTIFSLISIDQVNDLFYEHAKKRCGQHTGLGTLSARPIHPSALRWVKGFARGYGRRDLNLQIEVELAGLSHVVMWVKISASHVVLHYVMFKF